MKLALHRIAVVAALLACGVGPRSPMSDAALAAAVKRHDE